MQYEFEVTRDENGYGTRHAEAGFIALFVTADDLLNWLAHCSYEMVYITLVAQGAESPLGYWTVKDQGWANDREELESVLLDRVASLELDRVETIHTAVFEELAIAAYKRRY